MFDHENEAKAADTLVPQAQLRRELGNISPMTLWRWRRDPALGIPEPIRIRNRCYYSRNAIEAVKARLRDAFVKAASDV